MEAYVDANVILRFLVGDPVDMAEKAAALMASVEAGEVILHVDDITVAEVVWVLASFYKHKPTDIAPVLVEFLSQDGIVTSGDVLPALVLYSDKGIDFVDALLAVRMQGSGIRRVFSFDRHFDRVAAVRRVEPGGSAVS